jgi:hypothetical protein
MVVDTDPDPDVAAEWNKAAFYQYLMRQNEAFINQWIMTSIAGEEPTGQTGGLTKADKAKLAVALTNE